MVSTPVTEYGPVLPCTVSEMSAYWLKIAKFFLPHSHLTKLTPPLAVNPIEFPDELFIAKTRVLGLSVGEDFVILACVVLTQCQCVTDGRTDRQLDRS